ncbi:MAG: hypothetical protein NVS2B12_05150 [Ktedonobacteraceae bacterium]
MGCRYLHLLERQESTSEPSQPEKKCHKSGQSSDDNQKPHKFSLSLHPEEW